MLSNAVDPGWVPTKMGGRGAPDDLEEGHLTQTWLATSDDPAAKTSGGFWYHRERQKPAAAVARTRASRIELIAKLAELTGVKLVLSADVDVVIVGGGAAGVGAARRLAGSGLSTMLLEASSRLGGRACTQEIRGLDLDLGCGWLHSADRNVMGRDREGRGHCHRPVAGGLGRAISRPRFTPAEQAAAWKAFETWTQRLAQSPPASDCAADALDPDGEWNAHIRAIVGFISGATLERLSAADYVAYDESSSENNWRLRTGYGALVAGVFRAGFRCTWRTPVESIALAAQGVTIATPTGEIRARAAILTVSTACSPVTPSGCRASSTPGGTPRASCRWDSTKSCSSRSSARRHSKPRPMSPAIRATTHTASYYIRPFGWPVIECFFGGERARLLGRERPRRGFRIRASIS